MHYSNLLCGLLLTETTLLTDMFTSVSAVDKNNSVSFFSSCNFAQCSEWNSLTNYHSYFWNIMRCKESYTAYPPPKKKTKTKKSELFTLVIYVKSLRFLYLQYWTAIVMPHTSKTYLDGTVSYIEENAPSVPFESPFEGHCPFCSLPHTPSDWGPKVGASFVDCNLQETEFRV